MPYQPPPTLLRWMASPIIKMVMAKVCMFPTVVIIQGQSLFLSV